MAKPATKIKRKKSLYRRAKDNAKFQSSLTVIMPLMLAVVILFLWQTGRLHMILGSDSFTLPLPGKIVNIFIENIQKIGENTGSTLSVAFIGLIVGSLLGYIVAVLAVLFPGTMKGGVTVIGALASVPVVALAPVMNNWTKDISDNAPVRSMVSKIIVVALIAAANMILNAYRGLHELKPYSEDLMSTYAAGKIKTLFKLRLPNSVPYIFTALKVSVPASVMTTIVSEYFAEYITGVGRQIRENIVLAQYSTAWAYIMTACIIGIISYAVLMLIQTVTLRRYK